MAAVQEAPGNVAAETRLAVYDTDVHHGWESKDDFAQYIAPGHRERFLTYGIDSGFLGISQNGGYRGHRADLLIDGKSANSPESKIRSAKITRERLLDECGIDWALLTSGTAAAASFHPSLDYGNDLARAFNDFSAEQWLATDDRFRYAMSVNPRDTVASVKEIERFSDTPGVVAVMYMCGSPLPFGQRFFDPVHRACAERDLVWAMHFGSEGHGLNAAASGAGFPSYYGEMRCSRAGSYKAHIASFVFEGVFERYPGFKVAVLEAGFGWVPSFLWQMDQFWSETRSQTPWVKRPPSEYVFERVRFASQPEEEPRPDNGLEKILEWMHAEETLMFATDFPHWDWDDPVTTFKGMSEKLRRRIFSANAAEFFRS